FGGVSDMLTPVANVRAHWTDQCLGAIAYCACAVCAMAGIFASTQAIETGNGYLWKGTMDWFCGATIMRPSGPGRVLCHEYRRSKRRCATVREMKGGPSRSAIRC